jgi:antitoxin component HigA of HigAB toxin-antitoxin module/mRNA-degrading endonuclease HigB of HigAB toxin-antitoxin module
VFNIITRKTLLDYCKKYPEAATALQQWYYELVKAGLRNFNELKKAYVNVSLVGDDRVVFNIMGNKYRLVVRIVFAFKAIQIKWFGTHAEYDKINVADIKFKKEVMMQLKPIKTKKQYEAYLKWVDELFDKKVKPNTSEGEQVQIALLLIKHYEDEHYLIPIPDPIEAIKIKMEEKGLTNKDLVGIVGSKGYVSSLLNRRKPLTLEIAKIFHKELGVPADILLS